MEEIKKQIFVKRPVLGEIYKNFGHLKLAEYIRLWQISHIEPDPLFLTVLNSKANGLYGAEIAQKLTEQIKSRPIVSTVDHLGIWGHPIFVNATTIFSLAFKQDELVPVLATESVSLNNTSSWSGSVLNRQEDGKLVRHSFFPDRQKTLPVFSCPEVSEERYSKILQKIQPRFLPERLPEENNFSSQACLLSSHICQQVFPSAPKLAYLPLESIVGEYLEKVIKDKNHPIAKIIISSKGYELWQKHFSSEHTFLFWGIDQKGRRDKIEKEKYIEILDKNQLAELLEQRKIYASSPLCFLVLLYSGLTCAGGFTQTTWLSDTKEKIIEIFQEMGESDALNNINNMPTKNFAESLLASLGTEGEQYIPTALDLFNSGKDWYPEFKAKAEMISLKESIDTFLPEIYKVVCG